MRPDPKQIEIGMLPSIPWASRSQLPDCPAVYFALSDTDELLYIGRTISLKFRWRRGFHHKEDVLRGKCHKLAWLQLKPESLHETEQGFIRHYSPFLNHKLPKNILKVRTQQLPPVTCFRCGYNWQPVRLYPRQCANPFCKSDRWNDPTVEWQARERGQPLN